MSARGTVYCLHAPRMGTVTLRTDSQGRVVMRAHRTPFGVETAVEHLEGAPTDAWFTGKEVDASTGYVYFGARWYDPALGRFLNPDPLPLWEAGVSWGDANTIAYVGNRPTFMVDPTGLCGHSATSSVCLGRLTFGVGVGGCVDLHWCDGRPDSMAV